jgi:undecaprenyl-diphosphatase
MAIQQLFVVTIIISICPLSIQKEKSLNQYLAASFILIVSFIIVASLISPRINPNVNEPSSLQYADYSAFLQINDSHYQSFDQLMILLTQYGREVVWALASILLLIFGGSRGRKTVVIMAMAMIVVILIGPVAKEIIGRPRPTTLDNSFLVAPDKEFAFPSGHALLVSAGAAVMLALFRDSCKRRIVSIGLTMEAALVCFSRVYVGGHYPLDVVGGILLGVGVAFIFVASARRISQQLLQPIANATKG